LSIRLKLYYYDKVNMINKISSKMYYQDLYFSDRVETIEIYSVTADTPMQK